MVILLIGKWLNFLNQSKLFCFFSRAISFCEKKFSGIVNDVSKLTNELDRIFIAQITDELNSYLDAMEKTKFDFRLFFI